jgi:hypothetical protein
MWLLELVAWRLVCRRPFPDDGNDSLLIHTLVRVACP